MSSVKTQWGKLVKVLPGQVMASDLNDVYQIMPFHLFIPLCRRSYFRSLFHLRKVMNSKTKQTMRRTSFQIPSQDALFVSWERKSLFLLPFLCQTHLSNTTCLFCFIMARPIMRLAVTSGLMWCRMFCQTSVIDSSVIAGHTGIYSILFCAISISTMYWCRCVYALLLLIFPFYTDVRTAFYLKP